MKKFISLFSLLLLFSALSFSQGDASQSEPQTYIIDCEDIEVVGIVDHYIGDENVDFQSIGDTLVMDYQCTGYVTLNHVNFKNPDSIPSLIERWIYVKSRMLFLDSKGDHWYIQHLQGGTLFRKKGSLEYYLLTDL